MYASHFGLRDNPFSITPDPAYVYMSPNHREALAHLLYGTGEDGGFVQLTGEVGTGKTTLIRTLLEQRLDQVDVALCLNPRLTVEEFVAAICEELGVTCPRAGATLKPLVDALNAHLLQTHAHGRRTVLIIDEAQNLSREVLEQIRLLTNLETHRHKLLRIILVGQPELMRLLERQDMRQLAQRITARYHLLPLSRRDSARYVVHRLRVAGGREDLFSGATLRAVHRAAAGVPRLINVICDRALLGAYGRNRRRVDAATVRRAAAEALGRPGARQPARGLALAAALGSVAAAAFSLHLAPPPLRWPETAAVLDVMPPTATAPAAPESSEPSPAVAAESDPPADPVQALFDNLPSGDAMTGLLAVWGESRPALPERLPACEALALGSLRCLSGRGDWNTLRRYNRPALLALKDTQGRTRQVLLRRLEGDTATLEGNGDSLTLTLAALEPLWTGEYRMLWRLQTSHALIGPGSRGEPVRWLRRRLALAEALPTPAESLADDFDALLMERVLRFQSSRGLVADGWVGPQTMPHLNNLAPAPGTPLLDSAPAATVP